MSICRQGFNNQSSEMMESTNYWLVHSNSPWIMVVFHIAQLPLVYGSLFALVQEDERYDCSIMNSNNETILTCGRVVGYEKENPFCSSVGYLSVIFGRILFANSPLAVAREGNPFQIETQGFIRSIRFEKASECYSLQLRPSTPSKSLVKADNKLTFSQSPPSPTTVVDSRVRTSPNLNEKIAFDCSRPLEESIYLSTIGFSTSLHRSAIMRHSQRQHNSHGYEVPRLIFHVKNYQRSEEETSSYLNINGEKGEITHVMQINEMQIAILVKISRESFQNLQLVNIHAVNPLFLTPCLENKSSLFWEFGAIFTRQNVVETIKKTSGENSFVLEDSFSFRFKIDKWVVDKIRECSSVIFNGQILKAKLYRNQRTGKMYFCVELPKESSFIQKQEYTFHLPIQAELQGWAPLSELLKNGFV